MTLEGYCSPVSVDQGGTVELHLRSDVPLELRVAIHRVGDDQPLLVLPAEAHPWPTPANAHASGCGWPAAVELQVPDSWPSGVYIARVDPDDPTLDVERGPVDRSQLHFVVRSRAATSPVLVALPVATYQAYNMWPAAEWPGNSVYRCDEPTRSRRVSLHRPGGWEFFRRDERFVRWFAQQGLDVDWCTSFDLHARPQLLDEHRLLISVGHDEYWSKEMRDHVEEFIGRGGNVAFFSGNTCWWQIRLEDDDSTIVCYKDAFEDPLTGVDDSRVTVHWHHAPVYRPENHLTGVSSRHGAFFLQAAGSCVDRNDDAFSVVFPEHWLFDGVQLDADGTFGRGEGIVGYETDAAEIELVDGVPRATGRDGTPESFAVLATADLSHWRCAGQAGAATLGIYDRGGTVVTVGSVDWSAGLATGGAVSTITRNVIDRLSQAASDPWQPVGGADDVTALTASEGVLYATRSDGALLARDACAQNLCWRVVASGEPLIALGSSDRAISGVRLFGATHDGRLLSIDPKGDDLAWRSLATPPLAAHAIAGTNARLYALAAGFIWWRPNNDDTVPWTQAIPAPDLVSLGATYGALLATSTSERLLRHDTDLSATSSGWVDVDAAPADVIGIGVSIGYVYIASRRRGLLRRPCA